ncbi:MAG: hypothetical protein A3J93_01535 [Candidatus Magasanikbacteria bacterium RIFOXYC2_FULL_42_28]|uniref:YoaR-like putative peptidoglycan binding domain-containing protein n=1 Tax=Candidatus Magasanikbacteria bacterium RIFOXYC2_FULL_42_28 TaxID=1798704 RepID=A0A1F6NXW7_9BACT|nr:MAG: hypothetical protein A3J93_01535 [Candidatus Magasanikbacteria bacterium RIFOXYC2_FULL_42_28]
MSDILENLTPLLSTPPTRGRRIFKFAGVFLLIVAVFIAVVFGASAAYVSIYQDEVYPGVSVGSYHLGGSTGAEVKKFIEDLNDRLAKEGVAFDAHTARADMSFKINTVSDSDTVAEILAFDGDSLVDLSLGVGRAGAWYEKLFYPLFLRFKKVVLVAPVVINDLSATEILRDNLKKLSDDPRDAGVVFHDWPTGQMEIIPEMAGQNFDIPVIINQIKTDLGQLRFNTIKLEAKYFDPAITLKDAQAVAPRVSEILNYGNLSLNYIAPQTKARREWVITATQMGEWLRLKKDASGVIIFSLDSGKMGEYLEQQRQDVDVPARDAKFVMENDKVKEFQASAVGLRIDLEKTYTDLAKAFEERNYHPASLSKTVGLTVAVAEPKVQMASLNDLGIEGVIGVGVSSFVGSHTNRIKNIANAVKLLNGILIKPGEDFSTNKYSSPYTEENGYLPELVIKGNEIKAEVGGGMCQIGTTMFRMAMNSGMDITQRRNHSLVVSYYADPVNGNPGTDATLYEPSLDLKFLNDTGGYLLLQAEADYKKMELVFTLWGKLDGRKGWYTHPIVSKWISPGAKQITYTENLKPGVETCQGAYKGAVASFEYSRITPAGEKIDRVFESFYRALPQICLVGATSSTTIGVSGGSSPATVLSTEPAVE